MRYIGSLSAVVLVAEIIAAVAVAAATSWGLTVLLLMALSVLGVQLTRRELRAAVRAQRAYGPAGSPAQAAAHLADAAVRVGGGLLVVLPGFVTGAAGLLLLVPPVRVLARRLIGPHWARRLAPVVARSARARRPDPDGHPVIDGEVAGPVDLTKPRSDDSL